MPPLLFSSQEATPCEVELLLREDITALLPPVEFEQAQKKAAQAKAAKKRTKQWVVKETCIRLISDGFRWIKTHPIVDVPPLAFSLLCFMLQSTSLWMVMFARLCLFCATLAPLWPKMAWYYLTSSSVVKNVRYGPCARNLADVYLPYDVKSTRSWFEGGLHVTSARKRPVVVYVTGGAWSIGYKAWGSLVCKEMSEKFGCVCFCPDYRNFPQGTVGDMVNDVDACMSFVFRNIHRFGGDRNNISLVGQSAGAHLASLTVLRQSVRLGMGNDNVPKQWCDTEWPANSLTNLIGVSGIYDVLAAQEHLHSRGLDRSLLLSIFGGRSHIRELCPTVLACSHLNAAAAAQMPVCKFIHGSADKSARCGGSREFAKLLSAGGVESEYIEVAGFTHTDFIIEDLIRPPASHSGVLVNYVAAMVGATVAPIPSKPIFASRRRVWVASWINPF